MPRPPSIGASSAGLRYQVRFFWRQALPMLYGKSITKVVVEHRGVDAVDDVVVYYAPPGVNENGQAITVDFHQLKYHVALSGAVDHEAVIDPAWTGTTSSLLVRFCSAWKEIREGHPRGRLNLVTNWPWSPECVLAPYIRDGGRLDERFLLAGSGGKLGAARTRWQAALNLTNDEFVSFINSLRFSTSAVSQDDAEQWLRDRCLLAGLVPIELGADWSLYDDLGKRLIESGRTEHTPESLLDLVQTQGLIATKEPAFKSTFAVRSFRRFAHVPKTDGACVVDLTDLFDGRAAKVEDAWTGAIKQQLESALPQVELLGEPVHVALDAHLSIAWYTGFLLDSKSGRKIVLRQQGRGSGTEVWDVSAARQPEGASDWSVTFAETGNAADELAVVVSVTHSALTDATHFVRNSLPSVGTIVHAELTSGPGAQAVRDGGHARWLAEELTRSLTAKVAERRPARVHLFLACPWSLAFLLGQEGRVLGPTAVYEYDFGKPGRAYRLGITT